MNQEQEEEFWVTMADRESVNEYLDFIQEDEYEEWPDYTETLIFKEPLGSDPIQQDTIGMTRSYAITAILERKHITNQLILPILFVACITLWVANYYKRWKVKEKHALVNTVLEKEDNQQLPYHHVTLNTQQSF
ncbi:hypothetical protein A0J61_05363 [Choanephora cucurbitarum]|uniref:Uncharacterized protein n=1 Tax=Choanephora cucurbitarum TaxID=101091 RepID=A0A1C7NDF8_9FUNG|nr:hypothetical protein A0J61_05363 [Choanephora cucurbitarum]